MTATGRINERWELQLTEDRIQFHAERPTWEAARLSSMFDRVNPGMVVYDVGAESGDFTALYRMWVGPEGDVIPVEPSLPYWPSIRATWEANNLPPPRWCFEGFASSISRAPSWAVGDFGLRAGWPDATAGPIQPDFGFRHLAQQADENPQATLDDLCARTGLAPDILVLDIEGAEYDAMVGSAWLLDEVRPLVYISVHPPTMLDWYHRTEADLHALVEGHGYTSEYLGTHGGEDFWLYAPR